jgi:hypothetical protein
MHLVQCGYTELLTLILGINGYLFSGKTKIERRTHKYISIQMKQLRFSCGITQFFQFLAYFPYLKRIKICL